jgi:formyltetrahydrofolate deformylase
MRSASFFVRCVFHPQTEVFDPARLNQGMRDMGSHYQDLRWQLQDRREQAGDDHGVQAGPLSE